ncbi:hypothetical protein An14g04430 [Aspergillus niger]|uniref:Uncharacterized protein n=2 Tax=Aspergillus niger TaxID=5061 RepID=A2R3I7_ASPNC|nr:hypothetical protein An14g04430 [Aspergillus niger]CAK42005.1 hypothetical protein An14g04430 [Aspergillus niger]
MGRFEVRERGGCRGGFGGGPINTIASGLWTLPFGITIRNVSSELGDDRPVLDVVGLFRRPLNFVPTSRSIAMLTHTRSKGRKSWVLDDDDVN